MYLSCCFMRGGFCLSGCLDMIAVEGQFTFTSERPQLSCAAFLMAEPNEVVTVDYDTVDIDCRGGDFITVNQHATCPAFICQLKERERESTNSGNRRGPYLSLI